MVNSCPYCDENLFDLFSDAMDFLKECKKEEDNPEYDTFCPKCRNPLKFKVNNQWYCVVQSNGELRKIGID